MDDVRVTLFADTLNNLVRDLVERVLLVIPVSIVHHEVFILRLLVLLRVSGHHALSAWPEGILEPETAVWIVGIRDTLLVVGNLSRYRTRLLLLLIILAVTFQVPLPIARRHLGRTNYILLRTLALNKVDSFALWQRVSARHVSWVGPDEATRLWVSYVPTSEFVEDMPGLFEHKCVYLLSLLVPGRENSNKSCTNVVVPLVPLVLESLAELVPLLLGHHGVLVLPPVELLGLLSLGSLLPLLVQIQHCEGLVDHIVLYLFIERTVGSERSKAVHFDQPWFHFVVDEYVDAQHFKAHRVLQVVGLQRPVRVAELRLG